MNQKDQWGTPQASVSSSPWEQWRVRLTLQNRNAHAITKVDCTAAVCADRIPPLRKSARECLNEAWKPKACQGALTFREVVKLLRNSELPIQPWMQSFSQPHAETCQGTFTWAFQTLLPGGYGRMCENTMVNEGVTALQRWVRATPFTLLLALKRKVYVEGGKSVTGSPALGLRRGPCAGSASVRLGAPLPGGSPRGLLQIWVSHAGPPNATRSSHGNSRPKGQAVHSWLPIYHPWLVTSHGPCSHRCAQLSRTHLRSLIFPLEGGV